MTEHSPLVKPDDCGFADILSRFATIFMNRALPEVIIELASENGIASRSCGRRFG
jgi:hypothetical protein